MSDIALLIGNRIQRLRTEAELTQAELAHIAGVTVETVARLERNVRGRSSANTNPSLETLIRLAEGLGVSLMELLQNESTGPGGKDPLAAYIRTIPAELRPLTLNVLKAIVQSSQPRSQPKTKRAR